MYAHIHVYACIYINTRVLRCAPRTEKQGGTGARWQRWQVDTIPQYHHKNYHKYYHKHYHNFRTTSIAARREQEEDGGTTQEWTLSYFANIGTLPGLQQGLLGRACQRLRPRGRGCQRPRPKGQNEKQRLLEKSGHYPILEMLALCQDSGCDSTDEQKYCFVFE